MQDVLKIRTNRGGYVHVLRREFEKIDRTLLRLYNSRGERISDRRYSCIHRENLDPTGSATATFNAGQNVLGPDLIGFPRANDVKREISRLKQDPANYQIKQVGAGWIGVHIAQQQQSAVADPANASGSHS